MDEVTLARLKANIFDGAHQAIGDWRSFPWHLGGDKLPDTDRRHSSQALAIDVFGTLSASASRNLAFNAFAEHLGLQHSDTWEVNLEWTDHGNPLQEKRVSQIDAVAMGREAIILFECKFTESSGGCSQVNQVSMRNGVLQRQCNGNYEKQTNPKNLVEDWCALRGKGIQYWSYIPRVFNLDISRVMTPCPFRGHWYQLMRNLTLAAALEERTKKRTALVVAYAENPDAPMTKWRQSDEYREFTRLLKPGAVPFVMWSYVDLLKIIQEVDAANEIWNRLSNWVQAKCVTAFQR